jgi:small ligand-binding sensory domain FIST
MPFTAALSTLPSSADAIAEVCTNTVAAIERPDLAVLFFSPHHLASADALAAAVRSRVAPTHLVGCVGESILGNDREIEDGPAVSLWLARWDRPVETETFHLTAERTSEGPAVLGWPDALLTADPARSALLLLGDPMTFPIDVFLRRVNEDHRGLRVFGGMASGANGPGRCRLLRDGEVHSGGAVGVLLNGDIGLRTVVSQGCRPIGRTFVVTKADANLIEELGGRPTMEQLQELWNGLTPKEQELFRSGLHLGLVMNEYQGEFRRGDFLVRNVIGIERDSGALAITDRVRVGQTVQFHVRDADTADEDLQTLLHLDREGHPRRPAGALVFGSSRRASWARWANRTSSTGSRRAWRCSSDAVRSCSPLPAGERGARITRRACSPTR